MKIGVFWLKFYRGLFPSVPLKSARIKSSIGLDNGMVPNRQQTIIFVNDGIVYLHLYASLDRNELTYKRHLDLALMGEPYTYICTCSMNIFISFSGINRELLKDEREVCW